MYLFGRHQREAFGQVKAHLMTKHRACAGSGTIGFIGAVFVHMAHKV